MGASKLDEGVQAWWNQQPILPCVDKPGGINSRFCHVWTSLVESTADSATCGQALWNQQPILPCVDKPGGINRRFCHVWTSLATSHRLAWQNQQLILPGVDESGEGTPWQNQQPILISASESLVRIHMVESTADSARNVAESALVHLFTG